MNAIHPELSDRVYYLFEEPELSDGIDVSQRPMVRTVELNEQPLESLQPKTGFWRRQFGETITNEQKGFDWIFGIMLPIVCFYFDPIVFSARDSFTHPLLGAFKPLAYSLSFVAIMSTMAWLLWGDRLRFLLAPLSGLFLVSGIVSLAIGVFLIPFSLIGLVVLIGALGFTPLFTSFVFIRTYIRSFRAAKPFIDKRLLANLFVLGALASAAIPHLINVWFR